MANATFFCRHDVRYFSSMLSALAHMRSGSFLSAIGHAVIVAGVLGLFADPRLFQATNEPIQVDIVSPKDAPQFDAPDFGIDFAKGGKKETKGEAKGDAEPAPKSPSAASGKQSSTQANPSTQPQPTPSQPQPQDRKTQDQKAQDQKTQDQKAQDQTAHQKTQDQTTQAEPPAPQPEPPGQATFTPAPNQSHSAYAPTQIPALLDLVAPATSAGLAPLAEVPANIAANDVAAFKAHLRKCMSAPGGVAGDPKLKVTLRVFLARNGALAQAPMLMAATASTSGPTLVRAATAAMTRCAPFDFLPADRYKEWKVLDVTLFASDMAGG